MSDEAEGLAPINSMYPGEIRTFAFAQPPKGWLECDGRELSTQKYPDLYASIGSAWGSSKQGSFNVPDLRGYFLRGWSHTSGNDPDAGSRFANRPGGAQGDFVGTEQGFAIQPHSHSANVIDPGHVHPVSGVTFGHNGQGYYDQGGGGGVTTGAGTTGIRVEVGAPINSPVSVESRPKNKAVLFAIFVGREVG